MRLAPRPLIGALAAPAVVLAAAFVAAGPASASVGTNDYPYAGSAADQVDRWNFYTRECTSFVAWRLNHDNGIAFSNSYKGQHWGNAEHWDDAARAAGLSVNSTPTRGAVAVFNPGVDGVGSYGHVAYVLSATASTITVEDYNWKTFAYDQHALGRSGVVFIHLGAPSGGVTGTVKTSGPTLTVRSAPSTSASAKGAVSNGSAVHITCQTTGTSVSGTYGTSKIWDKISEGGGGYVSDAYVYTGSDGRVAPDC